MATIRRRPTNALHDLVLRGDRCWQDMLTAIEQAQALIRQFDSVRPLIEAARRNDELMQQAAEGLKLNSPALELARNLTAASDAMKDALHVNSDIVDIGKTIAAQMDTTSAVKAALQIDTSVARRHEEPHAHQRRHQERVAGGYVGVQRRDESAVHAGGNGGGDEGGASDRHVSPGLGQDRRAPIRHGSSPGGGAPARACPSSRDSS